MKFAIVDIETTGDQPKDLKIIEIAIVLHDGKKEIDSFHSFVNPEEKISPFISRLTGIKDHDVKDAPKFFEVAKQIIEFTKDTIFVAHNVSFDYGVIRREYKRLGFDFRMNHLCTIQTAKVLIPGHKSYGLKNITKELGIDLGNHHRAVDDARATAELFQKLFKADKLGLERFIKREIDPKILHPQLDIETYDEIPNKTGIYKFYDESDELIYIGKSIHIKKRIAQHLKNNKTSKGVELRQRIARIDHELTGSELIALLVESAEIKEKQPVYNRAQRNTSFTHGLYLYEDQSGYMRLQIKKNNLTEKPLITFGSAQKGKATLEYWLEEYELCQKMCHLYDSNGACFHHSIKKCIGACTGEESPEDYNKRVIQLMSDLKLNENSFLIVDKGRSSNEFGFVWIEKGEYKGYGFVLKYLLKKNINNFRKNLIPQQTNRDFQSIIKMQLDKNSHLNLFDL